MYLGKIVEVSDYKSIFVNPIHPYSQALLSAIPRVKINAERKRIILEGDIPSPVEPPEGCRFFGRCVHRSDICRQQTPELRELEPGRFAACHFSSRWLNP